MTTEVFRPGVSEEVWRRHPDYRALSVTARGFSIQPTPHHNREALTPPAWMDAHLEAWRNAFRGFGANPKKTPSSVESLWKRLQKDGELPRIHAVVDLYNSVSIRFGAPVGGEDIDRYAGSPRLGFALGSEPFDTARNGEPVLEYPEPGEIVWYDQGGVTCRRWNWRQCKRTGLSEASRTLWFVIDRLSPMPLDGLLQAGEALTTGLRELCPDVETSVSLLEPAE